MRVRRRHVPLGLLLSSQFHIIPTHAVVCAVGLKWIEPPKRERKIHYSVDRFFSDLMRSSNPAEPKAPKVQQTPPYTSCSLTHIATTMHWLASLYALWCGLVEWAALHPVAHHRNISVHSNSFLESRCRLNNLALVLSRPHAHPSSPRLKTSNSSLLV